MRRSGIFVLVTLAVPALSAAQQHGGGIPAPAMGHVAAPAPRVTSAPAPHVIAVPVQRALAPRATPRAQFAAPVTHRAGSATTTRNHGNVTRTTPRGDNFTSDLDDVDFQDAPGLGFDFPHLAAVSGNRRHHPRFATGVPFDAFLLASPSVIIDQPAPVEAQAQPATDDALAVDSSDAEPVHRSRRYADSNSQPAENLAPAPQRDVEEYVFVRRDGGLVFAVAYSWDNGTLRYVTPEGLRRSIGRDGLDLNATQQFNEQRGLNFRAPA